MSQLERFLEEGLCSDATIWSYRWGGMPDGSTTPRIIGDLARQIRIGRTGKTILVAGRYGSGKSSFMQHLRAHLEKEAGRDAEEGLVSCWIHLPVLTANATGSPVALVLSVIVEGLRQTPLASNGVPGADTIFTVRVGTSAPTNAELEPLNRAEEAAETLWQETMNGGNGASPLREAPRRSSLALSGSPMVSQRRARTIEDVLRAFLERRSERLVVFLDDLDRCRADVTKSIIQLLLQFSGQPRINFVVASDRRMIEHGVEEWMRLSGLAADGKPVVTANSALEKYVHAIVDMPTLDAPAQSPTSTQRTYPRPVEELLIRHLTTTEPRPRTLVDEFLVQLLGNLEGHHLRRFPPPKSPPPEPTISPKPPAPGAPGAVPPVVDDASSGPLSDAAAADEETSIGPGSRRPVFEIRNTLKKAELASSSDNSTDYNLSEKPTSLFFTLKEILARTSAQEILLRRRYLPIFRHLTLRQVKWFVREICLEPKTVFENDLLGARSIAGVLLGEIFPPIAALQSSESDVFDLLSNRARRLVRSIEPRRLNADLDAFDLRAFKELLDRTREISSNLREHGIAEYWPSQPEEVRLLVHLLGLLEDGAPGGSRSLSSPAKRPDDGSVTAAHEDDSPLTEADSPVVRDEDVEFVHWVKDNLGEPPAGLTIQAQVSSFQDMILERLGSDREGSHRLVREYANRYLEKHRHDFTREAAPTLSNLAVIIDDAPRAEEATQRLFSLAMQLDNLNYRIPIYYAEFLVSVLLDAGRANNLRKVFPTDDAIRAEARRVLETPYAGAGGRFHRELLLLAVKASEMPPAERYQSNELFDAACELIVRSGPHFVESNREINSEPFSRFDKIIDMVFGTTSQSIDCRGQLLTMLWMLLDSVQTSPVFVLMHLANLYAGEGTQNDGRERIGLRLNRFVLSLPELYGEDPRRAREIWSQSAAVIEHYPNVSFGQVALGFLATFVLGGADPTWLPRVRSVLRKRDPSRRSADVTEALLAGLRPEHRAALEAAQKMVADDTPAASASLLEYVFPEWVTPIKTPGDFAVVAQWPDEVIERISDVAQRARGVETGSEEPTAS